jgi:TolB protein
MSAKAQEAGIGIFEQRTDIGKVAQAGSVHYDKGKQTYGITGSGENMWFATDACSFLWKKWEGDVALSAAVHLVGKGKDPHRKACLMIRQGLEPDAAYVDVAVHGDGLISLQFRDTKGANTHEVQVNVVAPVLVQLVKRGSYALCYTQEAGKELKFSGAAVRIDFTGPTYVGLGVCAHDKTAQETALFVNVSLSKPTASESKPVLYSTLEYQSLASTDRRVVFVTPKKIEAPNWMPDGKSLLYNGEGKLHRIAVIGGTPETVNTGFAVRCNNDHGISPDGKQIVISDQSQTDRKSRIYTLPITGGEPKLVTPLAPSYWHGWSPDGKRLAYCAERNKEFDIYTIGVDGGEETRLTTAKGLDDGPEYSPDGKHIYFNSDRTGLMQIWRMNTDGSEQTQLFNDEYNNWFPHPSPDGKTVVFLSYDKSVKGHPENKDVMLRRLNLATNKIDVLAKLFGGQGTINVPCFSSDGRRIAFVTYQWIP